MKWSRRWFATMIANSVRKPIQEKISRPFVESAQPHPSKGQSLAKGAGRSIGGIMMKYMLLINEGDAFYEGEEAAQRMEETVAGHMKLIEDLVASGKEWSGERLQPADTATTIRYKAGEGTLHDGPYAESHEELGGFYVVDCNTLDEAIEWARKIPIPADGVVEVRPIWPDEE